MEFGKEFSTISLIASLFYNQIKTRQTFVGVTFNLFRTALLSIVTN